MNHPPQRLQWLQLTDLSNPKVTNTTTTLIKEEEINSKDRTLEIGMTKVVVIQSQNAGSATSYKGRMFLKNTFP